MKYFIMLFISTALFAADSFMEEKIQEAFYLQHQRPKGEALNRVLRQRIETELINRKTSALGTKSRNNTEMELIGLYHYLGHLEEGNGNFEEEFRLQTESFLAYGLTNLHFFRGYNHISAGGHAKEHLVDSMVHVILNSSNPTSESLALKRSLITKLRPIFTIIDGVHDRIASRSGEFSQDYIRRLEALNPEELEKQLRLLPYRCEPEIMDQIQIAKSKINEIKVEYQN